MTYFPEKSPAMEVEKVKERKPIMVDALNTSQSCANNTREQPQLMALDSATPESSTAAAHRRRFPADIDDGEDNFNSNSKIKEREIISTYPPGFRFCPTDEELILQYLNKKVWNQPLPINKMVEVNLYAYNPEFLAAKYQDYPEDQLYIFTPRDRKYRNGRRPNRAAGDGYWKATGADKHIKSNQTLIGYRKALVFYIGKAPRGVKTDWIMHEYRVEDSPCSERGSNGMRLDDWVLCRIYKKPAKPDKTVTEDNDDAIDGSTSLQNESDGVDDERTDQMNGGYVEGAAIANVEVPRIGARNDMQINTSTFQNGFQHPEYATRNLDGAAITGVEVPRNWNNMQISSSTFQHGFQQPEYGAQYWNNNSNFNGYFQVVSGNNANPLLPATMVPPLGYGSNWVYNYTDQTVYESDYLKEPSDQFQDNSWMSLPSQFEYGSSSSFPQDLDDHKHIPGSFPYTNPDDEHLPGSLPNTNPDGNVPGRFPNTKPDADV